jgi:hypothetical protein
LESSSSSSSSSSSYSYSSSSSSSSECDAKSQDFKLCELKFDMFIATYNFDVKNIDGRSTNGNSSKRRQTQFQTQFVNQIL